MVVSKKKRWNSQIVRLFWKQVGGASPYNAIERVCSQLTAKLGKTEPPYQSELYEFAKLLDIRVIESQIACEGILGLAGKRFVIQVKRDNSPERKSFTVCHELGHVEMLRCATKDFSELRTLVQTSERPVEEERLSDFFAANLLMPKDSFLARAATLVPSTDSVFKLAKEYRTSVESTAFRISELNAWKCHIFWCASKKFANQKATINILRFIKSNSIPCPFKHKGYVDWGTAGINCIRKASEDALANSIRLVIQKHSVAKREYWRLDAAPHHFKGETDVVIGLICPE